MSQLRKHDHTIDGSDWDLSSLSLKETPVEELTRNPKAKRIDLSNNMLTKLPSSFTSLTYLVSLDLSKNRLTELPESFGDLIKLNRLDLYGNKLKTLPISFGRLDKLKWLDLKLNPLDTTLAKVSGDCANQRQCELCAKNVIKFMKSEKLRIDAENRIKEEKLRKQKESEKLIQEKSKKEKERKKAKVARRHARKALESIDTNEDMDENNVGSDSGGSDRENTSNKSGKSFFSLVWSILMFLMTVSLIVVISFSGVAIGLHLQRGAKLESISDIKIALINAFSKLKDFEQFTSDVAVLFKALKSDVRTRVPFNDQMLPTIERRDDSAFYIMANFPEIVDLNVGGVNYTTSLSTLTCDPNSLLGELFTGKTPISKDSQGRYFIDRDGQLFRYIIDFLRNRKVLLPETFTERERLKVEAEHYRLSDLVLQLSTFKKLSLTPLSSTPPPASPGIGTNGYVTVGYRGSFAFGRDGLADVKFRKLTRILVSGKVTICREVFGETLNESRDPDHGQDDRYTARYFLKHLCLEQAFDSLQDAGFRCVGSCGSGTSCATGNEPTKPGIDSEETRWNHYNEFIFCRP